MKIPILVRPILRKPKLQGPKSNFPIAPSEICMGISGEYKGKYVDCPPGEGSCKRDASGKPMCCIEKEVLSFDATDPS